MSARACILVVSALTLVSCAAAEGPRRLPVVPVPGERILRLDSEPWTQGVVSPDGKRLALVRRDRGGDDVTWALILMDSATGSRRTLDRQQREIDVGWRDAETILAFVGASSSHGTMLTIAASSGRLIGAPDAIELDGDGFEQQPGYDETCRELARVIPEWSEAAVAGLQWNSHVVLLGRQGVLVQEWSPKLTSRTWWLDPASRSWRLAMEVDSDDFIVAAAWTDAGSLVQVAGEHPSLWWLDRHGAARIADLEDAYGPAWVLQSDASKATLLLSTMAMDGGGTALIHIGREGVVQWDLANVTWATMDDAGRTFSATIARSGQSPAVEVYRLR